MRIASRQRWAVTPRQAVAIQRRLRPLIQPCLPAPLPAEPLVAGADVSYDQGTDRLYAAVVVLRLPRFERIEQATIIDRVRFPYIPGLLSFRETPALLPAFCRLRCTPDVVLTDGHGLAHPRRFGIACHLGWLLDRTTIGCAKSILCGRFKNLGERRGSAAPLLDGEEAIGVALRTRTGVQPVYVSVGHQIDLARAVEVILRSTGRYRLPEPLREAHRLVSELRQRAAP